MFSTVYTMWVILSCDTLAFKNIGVVHIELTVQNKNKYKSVFF